MKKLLSYLLVGFILLSYAGCKDESSEPKVDNNDDTGCSFAGIAPSFESCVTTTADDELEVVTWNIENFPQKGSTTISAVQQIIVNTNADVIAVQEITDIPGFEKAIEELNDWEARIVDVNYTQELGFVYNTCALADFTDPVALDIIEPRQTVTTTITHNNGLVVQLFDIHLKCCDGADNFDRRQTASENLKDYIDTNLSDKNVMVLGDFNDELTETETPFDNFINDADNYEFTDMSIATGPSSNYSYPGYPSHIDHILITNELFDNFVSVKTLNFTDCVSGYSNDVSDHRPVMATFKAD